MRRLQPCLLKGVGVGTPKYKGISQKGIHYTMSESTSLFCIKGGPTTENLHARQDSDPCRTYSSQLFKASATPAVVHARESNKDACMHKH